MALAKQESGEGLPRVWRPRAARAVLLSLAALVAVTMALLALALPDSWTGPDRAGVVFIGVVCAAVMGFLARPRIVATAEGLTVVNVLRTWILTWPQIIDIRMPEGEPWPTLDLADGTSIVALGIQRSDGPRAETDLADLIALLHERGEAEEP